MRVDLDRGTVGVGAGWPNWNMAQQTQTITSTTSSLVQPWTGCVLHTTYTHKCNINTIINPIVKSTDTEKVVFHVIVQKLQLPHCSWMPLPIVVVV